MRVSSLDSLRRYLQIQLAIPVHRREPPHPTITISREAGAGAITVSWGRVIVVGRRGAEVVTKRLPYVFHVRLVASFEQRVQHAAAHYS
jgi:hypothetical protein